MLSIRRWIVPVGDLNRFASLIDKRRPSYRVLSQLAADAEIAMVALEFASQRHRTSRRGGQISPSI
jgi:hypothetical protein